ncbi:hypothetical protein [Flexivirga sp. B27]
MSENISHLDDPAAALRQVDALCPLTSGRTIVAAVRLTDQVVAGAKIATECGEESPGRAWLYSNHFRGTFDGDVYIVTPHGWAGSMDHRAGYEPHLQNVAANAPGA